MSDANKLVKVEGAADGSTTPHDGRYVVAWNPHTEFGTLELTSTADKAKAARFTNAQVFEEWNTVSRVQPRRPDGKPNKPLTGITISTEPVK